MIGELSGAVNTKGAGFVIVDVGGVGYQVYTTAAAYQALEVGATVRLHTHLAVREDAMTLFGFLDREELRFFEMLISVSGIGPKSALGILSLTDTKTLATAIAGGESAHLTKVSGIGRKTAEKIVIELREKVGGFDKESAGSVLAADSEALEALEALGYGVREAREVLRTLPSDMTDTGMRVREALKKLGK